MFYGTYAHAIVGSTTRGSGSGSDFEKWEKYSVSNPFSRANMMTHDVVNPNIGMAKTRVQDSTRMNPPEFHRSNVDKDPQEVSEIWFNQWKEEMTIDANPLDWDKFKGAFLDRFFPFELRETTMQEFINLKQGNMSVNEYFLKFTQLSKYAPAMVVDSRARINRIEVIHVAISEEELDWAQKIMSLKQSGMIRVNSTGNHESTFKDLSPVRRSNDSITQIERSMKVNSGEIAVESPNVRLQFRPSFDERNETATTGESSPGQGVHLIEISNHFDSEISGDINSDKVAGVLGDDGDEVLSQKSPCEENNIPKENNQDREHTPNHMMEPLQHDQEQLSIKETTDVNGPRQMQGDENATTYHTQEAQHTITKAITRAPQEKQQGNGGKAIWRVKDKINPNENTMQQSKEYGGTQPTSTIKEAADLTTKEITKAAPDKIKIKSLSIPPTRNVNHQIPDPAPPTVTQSLATRLRANQIKNDTPLDITSPIITTRQGYPSITFYEEDFMLKMPGRCKYTLVGKFSNAMPKVEVIKRSFIAQTQLIGWVKIVHFNSRHIYIDLNNEADHISVWTKQRMFIAGHLMKLQALYLDSATMQKTRGSVANMRVQIDITKERPQHVWLGFSEKDLSLGKWQIIEFEDVPPYCLYCKHQGHIIGECPMKERDEEIKKRKEKEAVKKGHEKQLNQASKGNQQHEDSKAKTHSNRQTNTGGLTEEYTMQKEEQWQTQTRRKNKTQQQNQDPGKKQIPQVQVQIQQAKTPHDQQIMQKTGMNSVAPVIEIEESGDQISTPPSPVIVEVEHCVGNEIPTPVIPSVMADEVVGGRMAVKEKTTNMQEWEPMGRELSHVLHENQTTDLRIDLQAPATTVSAVQQHQE
ncbi:hypothetical protein MTR67_043457 [Solanum verrucosum]|uniref:Retrotransposon gag domain-containing protein n=1 Tax=Solanum verrucosum TaxID=315347 RepID=A0AAF0ZS35_SOLVR|nr:hypothetical protein MTR67_043457 [Solanum verrucosum]